MKKLQPLFAWLKEAAKNTWSLLKGILLLITAVFLFLLATPFAVLRYFWTIRRKKQNAREILTKNGLFLFLVSLAVDHLANVTFPSLWNWIFLKDQNVTFKFGVPGQSLSLILGWNYREDNLTEWGANLYHDLDFIDPNHCEKTIERSLADARAYLANAYEATARIETRERTKEFIAKYN